MHVNSGCALVLVFALSFACSSSHDAPDASADASGDASSSPGAEPESLAHACQALITERAAFDERCESGRLGPSEELWAVDACVNIVAAPGSLVAATDVAACAAKLHDTECADAYPTCTGYQYDLVYPNHDRKGTLAPGAGCFAGLQCDSGYCSGSPSECGLCQRPRALGQTCADRFDLCLEGRCIEGTCQLQLLGAKLGEECIPFGPNGGCQEILFCSSDGVCAVLGEAGASCDPQARCARGFFCSGSNCVAKAPDGAPCEEGLDGCSSGVCQAGKCVELIHGIAEGEDCSFGSCRGGLECDEADKRCKPYVFVPEGGTCRDYHSSTDQCDPDGFYCEVACRPGNGCDETGICKPKPRPGEHCTALGTCADGAACVDFDPVDRTKSQCVKLGAKGEACPCRVGLQCIDAVCAPPHCD